MQFALLIYETEDDFASRSDDRQQDYWASWMAFGQAAGSVTNGGAALLGPEAATSLRVRSGERHVQDGPFPEAKEHLGGFFLIDVEDLDAALEWAARCPNAQTSTVEIRPLMEMG